MNCFDFIHAQHFLASATHKVTLYLFKIICGFHSVANHIVNNIYTHALKQLECLPLNAADQSNSTIVYNVRLSEISSICCMHFL